MDVTSSMSHERFLLPSFSQSFHKLILPLLNTSKTCGRKNHSKCTKISHKNWREAEIRSASNEGKAAEQQQGLITILAYLDSLSSLSSSPELSQFPAQQPSSPSSTPSGILHWNSESIFFPLLRDVTRTLII